MRSFLWALKLTSTSDILAELDIPPSGIQEVQDVVPYPKGTMAPGGYIPGEVQPPEILLYYSAQLYLRKLLNDIQKELYQESKSRILQYCVFNAKCQKLTTPQRIRRSNELHGRLVFAMHSIS